jgi:hypothetical protein
MKLFEIQPTTKNSIIPKTDNETSSSNKDWKGNYKSIYR